jgi:hypothetical protein
MRRDERTLRAQEVKGNKCINYLIRCAASCASYFFSASKTFFQLLTERQEGVQAITYRGKTATGNHTGRKITFIQAEKTHNNARPNGQTRTGTQTGK